jgi:hypothetical protein
MFKVNNASSNFIIFKRGILSPGSRKFNVSGYFSYAPTDVTYAGIHLSIYHHPSMHSPIHFFINTYYVLTLLLGTGNVNVVMNHPHFPEFSLRLKRERMEQMICPIVIRTTLKTHMRGVRRMQESCHCVGR